MARDAKLHARLDRKGALGSLSWNRTVEGPITRTDSSTWSMPRYPQNGYGPPTARTFDGLERRPFQPVTAETNALDKEVLVVPNPYFADGNHQYPNSRNLRFVGLPARCQIHIYSASGDRVQTIDHDNPAKGETEFKQITYNISGEVQTGLYYFVVVNPAGKTRTGSFVLIK